MIEHIKKYNRSNQKDYKFSLLIPTWNNIEYLKLCIESIIKNSATRIQIIVIVNEGIDGTLEWLELQTEIDFIHAEKNIGICYGLNISRSLIKSDYVVYLNDDMYVLPGWDIELMNEIKNLHTKNFMLSCTMIEPYPTGNPCVVVKNYGDEIQNFNENKLLSEFKQLYTSDWNGSTWPPNVVHIDMWDLVGGLSIEFSPGMYSDPDFSRKLYGAGVRIFKGLGKSMVYHFGSKSTKRVKKNVGRKTFLHKWSITSNTFSKKYLMLGNAFKGEMKDVYLNKKNLLINKLKRILSSF